MSNNHQFYSNFGYHQTFQNMLHNFVPPPPSPPPPPPPALFMVPPPSQLPTIEVLDKDYVKDVVQKLSRVLIRKDKPEISISGARENLCSLLQSFRELLYKEKALVDSSHLLSDDEWESAMEEVKQHKAEIEKSLIQIDSSSMHSIKKALAKRTSKRKRLKRCNIERKRAKEERTKELEERSRKIDENLQKIKDAVIKAKEEEEAKLQADMVLKEVLRKKHNAKKFINKLEALKKLRKARVNTTRGRGENVSEKDAEEFDGKIDKLKLLWAKKLTSYENEEEDLRAKLKQDSDVQLATRENETEKKMTSNLKKWRKSLFGDATATPQVDFNGDIDRFVGVRSQWDQYLNEEGTPLPVGWVVPSKAT